MKIKIGFQLFTNLTWAILTAVQTLTIPTISTWWMLLTIFIKSYLWLRPKFIHKKREASCKDCHNYRIYITSFFKLSTWLNIKSIQSLGIPGDYKFDSLPERVWIFSPHLSLRFARPLNECGHSWSATVIELLVTL